MNQLGYNITTEKPPIWALLKQSFPKLHWKDIAITYGDTIYSPNPVMDDVLMHELVHVRQQSEDKDAFVARFIADPEFRYKMELEAYREQYAYWARRIKNKYELNRVIERFAYDLSGPMYGKSATFIKAFNDIQNGKRS